MSGHLFKHQTSRFEQAPLWIAAFAAMTEKGWLDCDLRRNDDCDECHLLVTPAQAGAQAAAATLDCGLRRNDGGDECHPLVAPAKAGAQQRRRSGLRLSPE